ncbi:Hypothetical_protein [Hexamita inflata]|uniref:Hypothetical_protein n=1 Tax=Hexamita inflata TaxID=28002 RepID=A0AA86V2P1_9EUKA|nr:Hypothetical protein HINF_LOCUS61531 [Hexamita inflata]
MYLVSNRVVNYFTESKKQSPYQIQFNNIYQIKFNKSPALKYTLQLKNYLPKQLSSKSSQNPQQISTRTIFARRRQPGGVTASRFRSARHIGVKNILSYILIQNNF